MRNFELAVWAEHLDVLQYREIYPELRRLDVELYLAVGEDDFPHPALDEMDFRAWLILPEDKGYWVSVWNVKDFFELARKFLKYHKKQWIILDIEPPIYFVRRVTEGNFLGSLTVFEPPEDVWKEGVQVFRELLDYLHDEGVKVQCTTLPLVIDDALDGDDDISRKLGIYLPENCDEYSFMLYTTVFSSQVSRFLSRGLESPSFFVWTYSRDAVRIFKNVAVDVGLVGSDSFGNKGYSSPSELFADISAGLDAGVRKFHIWTIDNMRKGEEWEFERWFPSYLSPVSPPEDALVTLFRKLVVELLDR